MNVNNTLYIVPKGSLFEKSISDRASGSFVYAYTVTSLFFLVSTLIHLTIFICAKKYNRLSIHWVNPLLVLPLMVVFGKNAISLHYWGGDIYDAMYGVKRLELHCLRNSQVNFPEQPYKISIKAKVKFLLSLYVFGNAKYVEMTYKQYRILKYNYYRVYRRQPFCTWKHNGLYSDTSNAIKLMDHRDYTSSCRKVLVCHSATPDVNVEHSYQLLSMCDKLESLEIIGFISYGNQGEKIETVEEKYLNLFEKNFNSVSFVKEFLSHDELVAKLSEIHFLFFSCYRDEGANLVNLFLKTGGVCFFNRMSMNYDHFKRFYPLQVKKHEDFNNYLQ